MTSIDHVMIAVPQHGEEQARWFYSHLLGLEELPKPDTLAGRGGLWLRTGSIELHLGIDPDFVPARKAHVAFQVADLAAIEQRLTLAGIVIKPDANLPGFERFYVDDPFGNRIELLQPSAKNK